MIYKFKSILPHQVHIIKSCFPSTSFPGFSITRPYGARERERGGEPGNEVDFRLDNMLVEYYEFLKSHLFFNAFPQHAKKVVSDSLGLVDFAVGLVNSVLNPLSPNSDQHQFSPNNIHRLSSATSMRINQMIIKRRISDLLSISPNSFLKEMYRDQFGEFVCGYWCLKG